MFRAVERAQHREEIGGGLGEVPVRAEVQFRGSAADPVPAERQQSLAGRGRAGFEPDGGPGGVVVAQHAGRRRRPVAMFAGDPHRTGHFGDGVGGDAARPQDRGPLSGAGDHGGLEPDGAGAVVDDQQFPAERVGHVLGPGRAHFARRVGARRRYWALRGGEDRPGGPVGGDPYGDGVEPGAREQRNSAIRPAGHDDGEGAGPERLRERARRPVEVAEPGGFLEAPHVNDEGIEGRALLGLEDARDGAVGTGVGAEAVDRLGGKGDDAAAADQPAPAFATVSGEAGSIIPGRGR